MGSIVADEHGNPFYNKYKDHELMWPSLPGMAIITTLAVFGLVGNLSVAVVTFRHKKLRTNCNILLAMTCVSDSVHQTAHYTTSIILFSGLNFIPLRTCFYLQTLPLIGLNFGLILTLLVGVDRLGSVLFPVEYRRINFNVYILIVIGICSAYSFVVLHKAYKFMDRRHYAVVPCLIADAIPDEVGDFWFQTSMMINLLTILIYFIVWIILRIKTNANDSSRRIFKSLSAIMAVIFLGWVLNAAMRISTRSLHVDPISFYHLGIYGGCLINAACASNCLILFVFSKDYKYALGQHFNSITNKVGNKKFFPESRATELAAPTMVKVVTTTRF